MIYFLQFQIHQPRYGLPAKDIFRLPAQEVQQIRSGPASIAEHLEDTTQNGLALPCTLVS